MAGIIALIVVISLPLIIWFVLAKNNWFFTIVEEGTAKAVMSSGAFERIIFRWKAHFMDEEDNIWEEEDWEVTGDGTRRGKADTEFAGKIVKEKKVKGKIFGGLFWVGPPPFRTIHRYALRWTDFRQFEERGKTTLRLQFHDEPDRDFVMLKPAVYGIEPEEIETRPPERIRVTPQIPITMRIVNPRLFLFVAPPTPLEDILVKISALMRQKISMSTVDEIITLQGQTETLWEGWTLKKDAKEILGIDKVVGLKEEKLIQITLPKWGVRVAEKGVDIKDIKTPPDIQEAMEEEKRQDLLARARAAATTGTLISSEALARGKSKEEIQEEINKSETRLKEIWQDAKEMTLKKLAMESGSYIHGEFPQGSTLEALITLARRIPTGSPVEGSTKKPAETRGKTEERKPAKPTSILVSLSKGLSKQKPRKLTEEEKARLREELNNLPKEKKRQWQNYISRLIAGGYLKM